MPRVFSRSSALQPLAASLALALGSNSLAAAPSSERTATSADIVAKQIRTYPASQTRTVLNCTDSAPDSLRDIITNPNNPNHAQSGDTIDLSQLPVSCGMTESTITLSSGEIAITQLDLTIKGPGPGEGTVRISGGGASRVFRHAVAGTLSIHDLTIADGYYHAASKAYGGCIDAVSGSIYLLRTIVSGCVVLSDTESAKGGGMHSAGDVTLVLSRVSGNDALAPIQSGYGGGVEGNSLVVKYSAISGNVAGDGSVRGGSAGGAYAHAEAFILNSTIDHNVASYSSGLTFRGAATIANSTISGNMAHKLAAAAGAYGDTLAISNSTIAFNHAETISSYAAVFFRGQSSSSSLTLQSSIIADNTEGATNVPFDLSLLQGVLSGADNLVMASSISPPNVITVTGDPMLGELQSNGGVTFTHALSWGSPAIGMGNVNAMLPGFVADQRGKGYPRSTTAGANVTTDIGAFEFDSIFASNFDFQ
jgi:hypothetical protein